MNRFQILKSMIPGFLPLIVFIVADSIWGTIPGLVVAVVFGIGELIFTYLREKVVDKFIFVDTFLIVVLGLISILLENDIFFKLKPALIEFIFSVILAVSAFSPANLIMMMMKRYMKNMQFSEDMVAKLRTSLKIMFLIFIIHTALITYSAFFMSKEAWGFISGALFYIIFALYFVIEIVRKKYQVKKIKEEQIKAANQ